MLSCAGADRLQTGMRHAFGKPLGKVCRVKIGQPLLSVRTKDNFVEHAVMALTRAKHKFPGRQRVCESSKWGFTKLERAEYEEMKEQGMLIPDGVNVKKVGLHGPLSRLNIF